MFFLIFSSLLKALGKLGNIAETLCFLSMFPCLPTSGNIVAGTKFASQEAKTLAKKVRYIFDVESMFPSLPICLKCFQHEKYCFPN